MVRQFGVVQHSLNLQESDQLRTQIDAYFDNAINVGALLEETDVKQQLEVERDDLSRQLSGVRLLFSSDLFRLDTGDARCFMNPFCRQVSTDLCRLSGF